MLNLLTHEQLLAIEANKTRLGRNQFALNKEVVCYSGSDDPTRTALSYILFMQSLEEKTGGHFCESS